MMFNNGDIVVSKSNVGKSIEAVVDFQQGDKVYISEWGKNLKCPVRYVVDSGCLIKKEGKQIVISLLEMNNLMDRILGMRYADYNNEPDIDNMQVGQTLTDDYRQYKYVGKLSGEPVREHDGYFYTIDKEDIKKLLWNKEDVCQKIFGVSSKFVRVE